MSRRLAPLTQRVRVAGQLVSFPMVLHASTRASVLVSLPRRVVAALVPSGPFVPVPVSPRAVGCQVTFTDWVDSPVGPFREITVSLPVYVGTGSPVPGLAPLLHTLLDRTEAVGEYGFLPVVSLVDDEAAADLRRELWCVEAHRVDLRSKHGARGVVAQAEHAGDPMVRVSTDLSAETSASPRAVTIPLYGVDREGTPWQDLGTSRAERGARLLRPSAGHIALYAVGPLLERAAGLGATAADGFTRRARIAEVSTGVSLRWSGPRPIEDLDALDGAAFTGG